MDLYGRDRRLIRAEALVKTSTISARDKELIRQFETHLFSQNLSVMRVEKYLRVLRISAESMNKPFEQMTRSDIEQFIADLNRRPDIHAWSRRDYILFLRRFYRWLGNEGLVSGLKLPHGKSKIPNLLSPDEVLQIIRRNPHPRDKAMVAHFYDLGCRVGEMFEDLKVGDYAFEDQINEELVEISPDLFQKKRIKKRIGLVNLFGKTGARVVEFEESAPYVEDWLAAHPGRNNPKSYMWVDEKNNPLFRHYDQVRAYFLRLVKNAGIYKDIRMGALRHSQMTQLDDALRQTYLSKRHGTHQLKTYIHPELA